MIKAMAAVTVRHGQDISHRSIQAAEKKAAIKFKDLACSRRFLKDLIYHASEYVIIEKETVCWCDRNTETSK